MTRKTHQGIVGNSKVVADPKEKIGPGISFTQMNLADGDQIRRAAEKADQHPEK